MTPVLSDQERTLFLLEAERVGALDSTCAECAPVYHADDPSLMQFMQPNHTASPRCQSGRRAHCACATCF
jgi:hypothetical protein